MIPVSTVASTVMVASPPTADMDETLAQVRGRFAADRSQMVVLDGERVMGVISEKDVLRALSPNLRTPSETDRDLATLSKRVHQVMTHHPIVATPETPVSELLAAFRSRPIGCIPIVDPDYHLLGLVTVRSLLFALAE